MRIAVVLRNGQSIGLDVDDEATIGDIRAAAAAAVKRPARALTLNGSVLTDDVPLRFVNDGRLDVLFHEMRPTGWFLGRKTFFGVTPIHLSVGGHDGACLSLMLQRYPDGARLRDRLGETPFHYAARGGHRACVALLVQHDPQGAMVGDGRGCTPFHSASQWGRHDCLALLLQQTVIQSRW